ncbi:uncharacterized protein AB675_11739 [Cyphellophora attinorum]|uniref:Uncharacterized protein n=1 Tax=Cyphellophora attinorum TaxID=1664694 RepID=A0A0N0NIH9_9EURO|nr:uncharacterized protein AB675_11739 [Phialophora attinorum]KPI35459.1 hypothetical protein AB675_11739 [Phialophora attinorum]
MADMDRETRYSRMYSCRQTAAGNSSSRSQLIHLPAEVLEIICDQVLSWAYRRKPTAALLQQLAERAADPGDLLGDLNFCNPGEPFSEPVTTLVPVWWHTRRPLFWFLSPNARDSTARAARRAVRCRFAGALTGSHLQGHTNLATLPHHALAILSVHTKLHKIGNDILNKKFWFHFNNAEAFLSRPPARTSDKIVATVQCLSLRLRTESVLKADFDVECFRTLLASWPGLQKLELQAAIVQEPQRSLRPSPFHPVWIEMHRALLWFAATMTHKERTESPEHANVSNARTTGFQWAIWDEGGTVRNNEALGACTFIYKDQPVFIQVRLLKSEPARPWQVVEDPEAVDYRNWRRPVSEHEQVHPVCNVLLDCAKIRRWGWEALATHWTCRPTPYQMPVDATCSEDNAVTEDLLSVQSAANPAQATVEVALIEPPKATFGQIFLRSSKL